MFHECEIKLRIIDEKMADELRKEVLKLGFCKIEDRMESDYIMNVPHDSFKKNLFRVRTVTREEQSDGILYTLKIKGDASHFQENAEYEVASDDWSSEAVEQFRTILNDYTGILLPEYIFKMTSINEIIDSLADIGISLKRLNQKKRVEYANGDTKVLFDTFPSPVGCFLEIEAGSEKQLFNIVDSLKLDIGCVEKRNYGQIIRELTGNQFKLVF